MKTKIRPDDEYGDGLILKLREGTRVRLRAGTFHFDSRSLRGMDRNLLRRAKLEDHEAEESVAALNALLARHPRYRVDRLLQRDEDVLEAEKAAAEESRAEEIGDPNLYYALASEDAAVAEAEQLLDALNRLAVVELAYPQPKSRPAGSVAAPPTPDFSWSQSYLGPAPGGVDARYAWSLPGGRGQGIRLIDVEYGWWSGHEDFPAIFYSNESYLGPWIALLPVTQPRDHGTAVAGVIAAPDNGFGMTGIAPRASVGLQTNLVDPFSSDAVAIDRAAEQRPHAIVLEIQGLGPTSEFVPVEYSQAEFDTIARAVGLGIVVVEAAGNGGMDLGASRYALEPGGASRFNIRDSGAIVVAAGTSGERMPNGFTNFGGRIDVQGWGDSIATLGYNTSLDGWTRGVAPTRTYRPDFGGTSGAAAIVAGVVAAVQGAVSGSGRPHLTPRQMRDALRANGTPPRDQTDDTPPEMRDPRRIGNLPDIRRVLDALGVGRVAPVARVPILAKHSGLAVAVGAASPDNGAGVIQWDHYGGEEQLFRVEPVGGGYYKIVAAHSNKVLEVSGLSMNDNARIVQWDWWGGANQQFRLDHVGDGYYKIMARHSNRVFDVAGISMEQGRLSRSS